MGVSCFIYFFTSRVSRKTLPGAKKKKKRILDKCGETESLGQGAQLDWA